MGKVTKILIILIFVASLGFLLFTAKTIDRVETQKKLINSLQDNVSSLQNTINSLEGTINTVRSKIGSLRTGMDRLKKELARTIAERKKAEKELAETKGENKRLSTELNEAKEKVALLTEETRILERGGATLSQMLTGLESDLEKTNDKLLTAEDKLAKLESVGILVERETVIPSGGDRTPQIVKAIEGKIVDVKPNGVVAINFKGSINPQKGTTFYITNSVQVKAKLTLEEVYNTIMIANMEVEKNGGSNIKNDDNVRLILWTEE